MDKLVFHEYGQGVRLDSLEQELNLNEKEVYALIRQFNDKLKKMLDIKSDTFVLDGNIVYAKDAAGIFKVGKLEIEIVPKFLGIKQGNWKDDFLQLLLLTHSGSILYSEHIGGGTKTQSTLYDVLASEFIKIFAQNKKYYIRKYRKEEFFDYSIEGEIDFESIYENNPEGVRQFSSKFDKTNVYNATIAMAAAIIRNKAKKVENIMGLSNIISFLGKQENYDFSYKVPLKSRDRRWKNLYDVSYEVVRGMSFTYHDKKSFFNAPGYVFSTWQIWQNIIEHALIVGLKDMEVRAQSTYTLGEKYDNHGKKQSIEVRPDIVIQNKKNKAIELLVDAKYKGRYNRRDFSVSNTDVYEGIAFSLATGCKKLILLYPRTDDKVVEIGAVEVVNTVKVNDLEIIGAKVEMSGIASPGGIGKFIRNLSSEIRSYFD